MALSSDEAGLLRISKADRKQLSGFSYGVWLESSLSRPIDDLRSQATADRYRLALAFLDAADRVMRSRPPMFRIAIGRYYYAMYHAMRAVVYLDVCGDDHEQHSVLPGKTPHDFPSSTYWQNELKDARLRRNEADYDPYPLSDGEFRAEALRMKSSARDLVALARSYLSSKGCTYV